MRINVVNKDMLKANSAKKRQPRHRIEREIGGSRGRRNDHGRIKIKVRKNGKCERRIKFKISIEIFEHLNFCIEPCWNDRMRRIASLIMGNSKVVRRAKRRRHSFLCNKRPVDPVKEGMCFDFLGPESSNFVFNISQTFGRIPDEQLAYQGYSVHVEIGIFSPVRIRTVSDHIE